jgi:ABC-type multidrug transport system ATPase subunit
LSEPAYALWAEGVRKTFGNTEALKSAALWAEPGKVTTLLGRNGSGKTTLMKIAAGLLRADQGVVSLAGNTSERHTLPRLARLGLMYLPQEPLGVPAYRVRDLFDSIERTFRTGGGPDAIAETRLEGLLDQRVSSLSRGERVRVAMGLAFARRPTVLIADEPLVGLAPKDQESIALRLRRLAAEGTAIVTSGHDARVLLNHSDVVIWSVAGTTHHLGGPAEAADHWQFRREYLGPGFKLDPDPSRPLEGMRDA